jgi:deferrochelatase/peroxidase EfeB
VLAGGVGGVALGRATADPASTEVATAATEAVAFTGEHQAGIVTPAQDRLHFVALDVSTDSRDELVQLLKDWTAAARRMTSGRDAGPVGAVGGGKYDVPDDTGEAIGLPPSGLTVTSCPRSPATRSSPSAAAATCASRPAPTTRRWRCTPSGT